MSKRNAAAPATAPRPAATWRLVGTAVDLLRACKVIDEVNAHLKRAAAVLQKAGRPMACHDGPTLANRLLLAYATAGVDRTVLVDAMRKARLATGDVRKGLRDRLSITRRQVKQLAGDELLAVLAICERSELLRRPR